MRQEFMYIVRDGKIKLVFSGAIAKLRKATISVAMSVCLSVCNNSAPTQRTYTIKIKYNVYSVCLYYLLILLFQMLATIFGLTRPSLGQYLQKLKNPGACSCQHLKQLN